MSNEEAVAVKSFCIHDEKVDGNFMSLEELAEFMVEVRDFMRGSNETAPAVATVESGEGMFCIHVATELPEKEEGN